MLRYLRKLDGGEYVGVTEISERLRVSAATVRKITYAEDTTFPKPYAGRGPERMWLWCEVLDWYMTHRILYGPSGSHIPQKHNRYRNQNRAYRRS